MHPTAEGTARQLIEELSLKVPKFLLRDCDLTYSGWTFKRTLMEEFA